MNLLVEGQVVRTTTGPNTQPDGSKATRAYSWDVGEFTGRTAQIQIVDNATGGRGHVKVDYIVRTDRKPSALLANQQRELEIEQRYLNIPIKKGSPKRKVSMRVPGRRKATSRSTAVYPPCSGGLTAHGLPPPAPSP